MKCYLVQLYNMSRSDEWWLGNIFIYTDLYKTDKFGGELESNLIKEQLDKLATLGCKPRATSPRVTLRDGQVSVRLEGQSMTSKFTTTVCVGGNTALWAGRGLAGR